MDPVCVNPSMWGSSFILQLSFPKIALRIFFISWIKIILTNKSMDLKCTNESLFSHALDLSPVRGSWLQALWWLFAGKLWQFEMWSGILRSFSFRSWWFPIENHAYCTFPLIFLCVLMYVDMYLCICYTLTSSPWIFDFHKSFQI